MTSRKATLMVRFKAADGTWKRAEAARGPNGRIQPRGLRIDGKLQQLREGAPYHYQLRYYQGRLVKYQSAGQDSSKAETLRRRIEQQESVKAEAVKVGVKIEGDQVRKTLAATAADYIRDAALR